MNTRFNLNRPKPADDEIEKAKDFDALVSRFKKESIQKAKADRSWRSGRKVVYTAVILGVAVVCTVTLLSISREQNQKLNRESGSVIKKSEPVTKRLVNTRFI